MKIVHHAKYKKAHCNKDSLDFPATVLKCAKWLVWTLKRNTYFNKEEYTGWRHCSGDTCRAMIHGSFALTLIFMPLICSDNMLF